MELKKRERKTTLLLDRFLVVYNSTFRENVPHAELTRLDVKES